MMKTRSLNLVDRSACRIRGHCFLFQLVRFMSTKKNIKRTIKLEPKVMWTEFHWVIGQILRQVKRRKKTSPFLLQPASWSSYQQILADGADGDDLLIPHMIRVQDHLYKAEQPVLFMSEVSDCFQFAQEVCLSRCEYCPNPSLNT